MPHPNIVKTALQRFFAPGGGSWQALLRQRRLMSPRAAAPSRADFADTMPGVFRSEAFEQDLYDIQLSR